MTESPEPEAVPTGESGSAEPTPAAAFDPQSWYDLAGARRLGQQGEEPAPAQPVAPAAAPEFRFGDTSPRTPVEAELTAPLGDPVAEAAPVAPEPVSAQPAETLPISAPSPVSEPTVALPVEHPAEPAMAAPAAAPVSADEQWAPEPEVVAPAEAPATEPALAAPAEAPAPEPAVAAPAEAPAPVAVAEGVTPEPTVALPAEVPAAEPVVPSEGPAPEPTLALPAEPATPEPTVAVEASPAGAVPPIPAAPPAPNAVTEATIVTPVVAPPAASEPVAEVLAGGVAAAAAAAPAAPQSQATAPIPRIEPSRPPADDIFRGSTGAPVDQAATRLEQPTDEERKLAAERAARKEAREAALAAPPPVVPVAPPAPQIIYRRSTDRFVGSLGLFIFRVVLAGIFAIRGLDILSDIPAARDQFATTILAYYQPGAETSAIITGVACLAVALALVLGLLTRVAGLGIALIAGGALAFVYWGPWSPFIEGQAGFLGEYQLVLVACGLLLLCVGGGGWSLDRSFRAGRERNKRERSAEVETL